MQIFTVVFAHGRESGPWGVKIRALSRVVERLGGRVVSRDDTDTMDPELRVARMVAATQGIEGPLILVGSSMGGYVAAVASREIAPAGLFLMAPAIGVPGYAHDKVEPVAGRLCIVHGWQDDIVPLSPVLDFARENNAFLHVVPAAHALIEQVRWLEKMFAEFLAGCLEEAGAPAGARFVATL